MEEWEQIAVEWNAVSYGDSTGLVTVTVKISRRGSEWRVDVREDRSKGDSGTVFASRRVGSTGGDLATVITAARQECEALGVVSPNLTNTLVRVYRKAAGPDSPAD